MAEKPGTPAVAALVAEYHAQLYRYAYRLTGSVCDAEDLTQQTFLAAHRSLNQLRSEENCRGWLFSILRSYYLKLNRRRRPISAGNLDLDLDTVPDELPAELMIDQERLQTALDTLPDEFKLVLLMFYFEESSYREIADRLELPLGTVMSRLSRAKRHLRSKLEPAAKLESAVQGSGANRSRTDGKVKA